MRLLVDDAPDLGAGRPEQNERDVRQRAIAGEQSIRRLFLFKEGVVERRAFLLVRLDRICSYGGRITLDGERHGAGTHVYPHEHTFVFVLVRLDIIRRLVMEAVRAVRERCGRIRVLGEYAVVGGAVRRTDDDIVG